MAKISKRKDYTSVSIPLPLAKKAQEFVKGTGFTSVSDFVTYLLREFLSEKPGNKKKFTTEEEKGIRERLRTLGYL